MRNLQALDTYTLVLATLFNNTPSNFAIVRGVPSHSSMLTRSFVMVNKLETGEDPGPYCYVMLHR